MVEIAEKKPNLIMDKSLAFWIEMITLYKFLTKNNEFIISKQLLRSGTSIWANITESKFWSSKKDFINKLTIALKEANETLYWLTLLQKSNMFDKEYQEYIKEANSIIWILVRIINTTKKNMLNP